MNKQIIEQLLLEEMTAVLEEKELDENILKRIAAQIKGFTSRGKDSGKAQEPSEPKTSPAQQAKSDTSGEDDQSTQTTPAVDKKEQSRIDQLRPPRSTRDIRGSENYKKFMTSLLDFFANESKIDINIAKKIVRDIWSKTPTSGRFDKIIFKEAMEKEIDVAAILADSGLNPAQQIKVLRDLKSWASQNSDIVGNKITKIKKLQKSEQTKEKPDFNTENGMPLNDAARDMLLKILADPNVTKDKFEKAYDRLRLSKYAFKNNGRRAQKLKHAILNKDPKRISGFGRGDEVRIPIRKNFLRLYANSTTPRSVVGLNPSTRAALSAKLEEQLNRMQTLAGINKKVL
jgi:hypothetical protein